MKNYRISNMTIISMCVALIALFSWLYIPFAINFTLQTLAVFVISAIFNLRISLSAVIIYILLGACGLPVFSGFGAGIGVIFGPTGGYILSFMVFPPIIHIFVRNRPDNPYFKFLGMSVSLVLSYIIGALWYYVAFGAKTNITLWQLLGICVFPFVLPDIIKMLLAVTISQRLGKLYIN